MFEIWKRIAVYTDIRKSNGNTLCAQNVAFFFNIHVCGTSANMGPQRDKLMSL